LICLDEQIQSQLGSFGARLQHLRVARGWTLQDLAERSGLSRAFLSRLESGDRQASIAAVLTLSRIFEVSLASLFETEVEAEPCVIVRHAESVEQRANGLVYVALSKADSRFNLQPIRVRVSRSRRGLEHYHHEGEEWIYVLSGALTLSLAGKTFDLEAGDAAHFDSRLPHRLIARGNRDPELLVVASPLSKTTSQRPGPGRELRAIPSMRLLGRPGPTIRSPRVVNRKPPSANRRKGKSST
jgi:transcriptional regulator with XRE-family HTH domain